MKPWKWVLLVGALLAVYTLLFPLTLQFDNTQNVESGAYYYSSTSLWGGRIDIDYGRTLLKFAAVVVATGGGIALTRDGVSNPFATVSRMVNSTNAPDPR